MFNRREHRPAAYEERKCLLVSYRLPGLPYCYVLCSEQALDGQTLVDRGLWRFFMEEAQRLAYEDVGDPNAFMLIHSAPSAGARSNFHLHVFVLRHRWQKAWLYFVLAAKNLAQTILMAVGLNRRG
ncbi:hypothetical protein KAK11_03580 [Ideonella paludis]|uniref:HIT domain-containing protein n=2 Tax=Ideonella paludis TaxID=1233411 RepID=A0ABS5DTD0_9BURK|nr:hypothetical protein [Ideonella paludis]